MSRTVFGEEGCGDASGISGSGSKLRSIFNSRAVLFTVVHSSLVRCYEAAAVLLLCCCCVAAVLLLCYCCVAAMLLLCCSCVAAVLLLCCCCVAAVLLLCCCCVTAVLLLCCCCVAAVLLTIHSRTRKGVVKYIFGELLTKLRIEHS